MQITQLRLHGFKSFVDPTELAILPGLTGIVGPNGCGKSNLLEAIRWVMGETRPTSLRGDGMEDVIFGGSARRSRRLWAEVALVLDNTARRAPSAFNTADTLEVTRRVTRDLGSVFRINGREVRARDVQMLFADAATGATSPGMVRQGQVAELIAARPRARRRVLEDAAGIAGLIQRRQEAVLKLDQTEANLARVSETLATKAERLAELARQAKKAQRFRELTDRIIEIERQLAFARWAEVTKALRAAEAALADALRSAFAAQRKAEAAAEARAKAEAALTPLREEVSIATTLVTRAEAEAARIAEAQARAQAALAALAGQRAEAAEARAREERLAQEAGETCAELEATLEDVRKAIAADPALVERAEAKAQATALALAAEEAALAQAAEVAATLAARVEAAETALARARAEAEQKHAKGVAAARACASAEAACMQAKARVAAAERAQQEAEAALAQVEASLTEAEALRPRAEAEAGEARAALSAITAELRALVAEEAALARARYEGGSWAGVLATLAVAPGVEKALAAVLGEAAALSVAPKGPGWRTLPPLSDAVRWPQGVQPLAEVVKAPPALARCLAYAALTEAERAEALQPSLPAGACLVALDGTLWRWDGAVLPATDSATRAAHQLEQENRRRALEAKIATLREHIAHTQAAAAQAEARLQQALAAERANREARRVAERRLAEATRALQQAEAELSLTANRLALAQDAARQAEVEAKAAALQLAQVKAALQEADRTALEQARQTLAECRAELVPLRAAAQKAAAERDKARAEAHARQRRQAELARELEAWRRRQQEALSRAAELAAREHALLASLEAAREEPAALAAKARELSDALVAHRARAMRAHEALSTAEMTLHQAREVEREATRALSEARAARAAAEARLEAAQARAEAMAAEIRQRFALEPEALATLLNRAPEHLSNPAELEAEVLRLERAREALGPVNLCAEEEQAGLAAEHNELVAAHADLVAAVERLRRAIGALNREGRERLLSAFDAVNAHFAALFTHLFGGGRAHLQLVDSDDPLEAGLEIYAEPPGKKLSSLALMSGGEQTLTALALIFAVFLTNPAPLAVLDEVDAPLDDANVARFCALLDEIVRRTGTRILLITHNPITMARMDRLYGVTMVEPGVSQLVSVDLKAAEALVA